jgi:hypothetical protein
MLFEDESKKQEAEGEYRQYLNLAAADANDRVRIERRLEKLTSPPLANTKQAQTDKK